MAQSVKRPTLYFGSGYDLTVCEIKPRIGPCTDSVVPACDSLSLSLSAPALILLFLSQNKYLKNVPTLFLKSIPIFILYSNIYAPIKIEYAYFLFFLFFFLFFFF